MRRLLATLCLAAVVAGQEPGRDSGNEGLPVLFVRWERSPETSAVYREAWSCLEPHFGVFSRRRLAELNGDATYAAEVYARNKDAALVVAFGAKAAAAAHKSLPGISLLLVDSGPGATVRLETDRTQLSEMLRVFRPGIATVACFSDAPEKIPGLKLKRCKKAADAEGCDVAWIPEGSDADANRLRPRLDAMKIPLVSTSDRVAEGLAALSMRPDPRSAGKEVAVLVLRLLRDGIPFRSKPIERMTVRLDLRAAKAAGYEVPLRALARADRVRR